jgi:hypothetical protein
MRRQHDIRQREERVLRFRQLGILGNSDLPIAQAAGEITGLNTILCMCFVLSRRRPESLPQPHVVGAKR